MAVMKTLGIWLAVAVGAVAFWRWLGSERSTIAPSYNVVTFPRPIGGEHRPTTRRVHTKRP